MTTLEWIDSLSTLHDLLFHPQVHNDHLNSTDLRQSHGHPLAKWGGHVHHPVATPLQATGGNANTDLNQWPGLVLSSRSRYWKGRFWLCGPLKSIGVSSAMYRVDQKKWYLSYITLHCTRGITFLAHPVYAATGIIQSSITADSATTAADCNAYDCWVSRCIVSSEKFLLQYGLSSKLNSFTTC